MLALQAVTPFQPSSRLVELPSCQRLGLWDRIVAKVRPIFTQHYYLAKAEIIAIHVDQQNGDEIPAVLFKTHGNQLAYSTLDVKFCAGTHEPGNTLTIPYDDRLPTQATWAGRDWRNEPVLKFKSARWKAWFIRH